MKVTAIIKSGMGIYFSRPKDPNQAGWTDAMTQSSSIAEVKQQLKQAAEGSGIEYEFLYDLSCFKNLFEMIRIEAVATRAHLSVGELQSLIFGDEYADNNKRIRVVHALQKLGLELAEVRF